MNDNTETLLLDDHVQLPNGVLIDLLAKCEDDSNFFHRISKKHRFNGAKAIALAKSSPSKARVIATRTDDVEVQKALFELSNHEGFDRLLDSLADSDLISDPSLLQELHDKVYGLESHGPRNLVKFVPIAHMVSWLERPGSNWGTYPVDNLAVRVVADAATTGQVGHLHRFVGACSAHLSGNEPMHKNAHKVHSALHAVGKEISSSGASHLLGGLLEICNSNVSYAIAISAWQTAPTIDEFVASAAFSAVGTESFLKEQQYAMESPRIRDVPQYPKALERQNLSFTDAALVLVGSTWPALLLPKVQRLANDDPQRDMIVELSLASRRIDLVERLLSRGWSQDETMKGPILSAKQYKTAANIFRSGVRFARSGTSKTYVSGTVSLSYVPKGADVRDVLKVWRKDSVDDIVETLINPGHASWHAWRPDSDSFEKVLDECPPDKLRKVVRHGLYAYNHVENRPSKEAFAITRPYLDMVVERLTIRDLLSEYGAAAYVADRLTEHFGTDTDRWTLAWELAHRSAVGLSAVISAAEKLPR